MSTLSTEPARPARFVLTGALVFLFLLCGSCVFYSSCTRVDVGHVGIRVRLAGDDRGVEDAPIVTGWVLYNPATEDIIEFPTNVQNVVWTADLNEGAPVDESITFASREGVSVNADVGLAFHIEREMAPRLYSRFRERDVSVLAHGYVRNVVREAISEAASQMQVQDIYGVRKTELLHTAQAAIEERLGGDGFVVDQLTFVSALRLPENVVASINDAMAATQNAIQAENRVRQVRAEAEQTIAQARGDAEAARQRAQGEADAILIRARAEAQANEIIRLSTSPEVIAYRQTQRWDGQLPVVVGSGNVPMLTLESSQFLRVPEAERSARLRELLGSAPAFTTSTDESPVVDAPATP
jgi:regulator of protease activity HflC (stomatin/prohibitin superfamily)